MAPKKAGVPSRSASLAPHAVLQAQLHVLRHLIHTLLHTRGLYPAATFQQHVLYGVQGWRSRIPGVISHLDRAIEALETALTGGGRGLILLVFLDGEVGKERWLFDFRPFVDVSVKGMTAGPTPDQLSELLAPLITTTIQDSLSLPTLKHSDESSYTILLEIPSAPAVPAGKEGDWVPPLPERPDSVGKGVKWVGVSETSVIDLEILVQQMV